MANLKLISATCLMFLIIVASAVATENETVNFDLMSFDATQQDKIMMPLSYNLQFRARIIYDTQLKGWRIKITNTTFIKIKFVLWEPINQIALYTNNRLIVKDTVSIENQDLHHSDSPKSFKPVKHFTEKNIHIIEFSTFLTPNFYNLNLQYGNKYPHVIEKILEDQLEESVYLYTLLDSSNDFGTVTLTSEYSQHPTEINIEVNETYTQLFVNTVKENLKIPSINNTKKFDISSMSIHQVLFLMGVNFVKTEVENIIFWHSLKIKKYIEHAINSSREMWLQTIDFTPHSLEWSLRNYKPAYSIISSHNTHPTASSLGLIVYRESDVTFDVNENYFARKTAVEMAVSYEMARQSFCYIVYPSSWVTKCLHESFAVYQHYTMLHKTRLHIEADDEDSWNNLYVVQVVQPSLHNDAVFRLKAIDYGIKNPDEIDKSFSFRLYYNKGSALLRMLENIVKPNVMHNAIIKYIQQYTFKLASDQDFWNILTKEAETKKSTKFPYKEIMHLWLSKAYYPEIHIETNYTHELLTVYLSQYTSENRSCAKTKCIWPIFTEICLYDDDHLYKRYKVLFDSRNVNDNFDIGENHNFVMLSLGYTGFHRVNYDERNWIRIVQFLNHKDYKNIHVVNRAQLIDNSYHFVMNGKLSWAIFLQLTNYLKRETSYIAWYPFINIMFYMRNFFHHPSSQIIKPKLAEIFGGLLENIGYTENENDNDMKKSLRMLASWWACKLGHRVCRQTAAESLFSHLFNPSGNPVKPWWERWMYCAGIMESGTQAIDMMLNKYYTEYDKRILKFMACTESALNAAHMLRQHMIRQKAELPFNISKLKYRHLSPIVKLHATNENIMHYVINVMQRIMPRLLFNNHFWADIILSIYEKKQLIKIMNDTVYRNTDYATSLITDDLGKKQLQRINKLLSTNYYI